jgi:hypothetical protein
VLAGLCAAAIVLVHGTEVYTTAVGLLVLAGARWRRIPWPHLGRALPLALATAICLAAPYLPTLFGWAAAGGATSVGEASAQTRRTLDLDQAALFGLLYSTLGIGIALDLPFRVGLLLVGVRWVVQRGTGLVVVAVGAVFLGLALVFAYVHHPFVEYVYAATFPWAQPYRLLMVVAVMGGLLQGAGAVVLAEPYARRVKSGLSVRPSPLFRRLAARAIMSAFVVCSSLGLAAFLSVNATSYTSWSADDAAAMSWLRSRAHPSDVLVNDGFADAGIWAPYKAGLTVLVPRLGADRPEARSVVVDNIAHLDRAPDGLAAACELGAAYVFRGAHATAWDSRRFPPVAELEHSAALEEVFTSGDAAVFRLHIPCGSSGAPAS